MRPLRSFINRAWPALDRFLDWSRTKNRVTALVTLGTALVLLGLCPVVSADQGLFDKMNYVSMAGFNLLILGVFLLFFSSDNALLGGFGATIRRSRNLWMLLLVFLAGTGLGLLVWNRVQAPFSNPLDVVGELTVLKFSPVTNYLRFLVVVSLPAVLLGIAFVLRSRNGKGPVSIDSSDHEELSPGFSRGWLNWIAWVLGIAVAILFILSPVLKTALMSWLPSRVDFLHEGETLTPAYNYKVTGGLWTASCFCHGVLYDPLTSFFGWRIFGAETIGSERLATVILDALNISVLGILIVVTSLAFVRSSDWAGRLLFSQLMMVLYLLTLDQLQYLDRRGLFLQSGLCFLLVAIWRGNLSWFFIAGTGSALAYFYSIDMGAYYTCLLVVIMAAWLLWPSESFQRRLLPPIAVLAGVLAGWLGFYAAFGATEFRQFIATTELFYQTKDLMDSYVFTLKDSTALVSIMAIGMQALVLAWRLGAAIINRDFSSRRQWMVQAVFTVVSIFCFRSALGRSDEGHIEYSSTFAFVGLAFPVAWLLREIRLPRLNLFLLAYLLILNLFLLISALPKNWSNLGTVLERFHAYAQLPDSAFLNPDEAAGIAELQAIFKDEQGVFTLNSEVLLPYLLKKPSLGMNYLVWGCGSRPKRIELMETLQKTPPRYLIFDDNGNQGVLDGITNQQRFPAVRDYITAHYHQIKYVQRWQVYERNQD